MRHDLRARAPPPTAPGRPDIGPRRRRRRRDPRARAPHRSWWYFRVRFRRERLRRRSAWTRWVTDRAPRAGASLPTARRGSCGGPGSRAATRAVATEDRECQVDDVTLDRPPADLVQVLASR